MALSGATAMSGLFASASGGSGSATPFLVVRTGSRYATLAQAVTGSISGDTIKVAPGTYVIPAGSAAATTPGMTVWGPSYEGIDLNTLTIEWEVPGSMPIIDLSAWAFQEGQSGGRPFGIKVGSNNRSMTIRGLHLIGHPEYGDGYGIVSLQGYLPGVGFNGNPPSTLNIDQCKLVRWADGVKATDYNKEITINVTSTVIEDCTGNFLTHGIYASSIAALNVRGCTFRTTVAGLKPAANNAGHLIKSRARVTVVEGSLFDPKAGCASCIEAPSGGALTVAGNIILHYGQTSSSDDNPAIKYGFEESASRITVNHGAAAPFTVGENIVASGGGTATITHVLSGSTYVFQKTNDSYINSTGQTLTVGGVLRGTVTARMGSPDGSSNDGRTHSITVAQNTIRKDQPGNWSGSSATAIAAMWVSGNMTLDNGTALPRSSIPRVVQNNIIGDLACGNKTLADGADGSESYPNNTAVARSTISDLGVHSSTAINCSPSVQNASWAWAGELLAAVARSADLKRGGRPPITVPSWRVGMAANTWKLVSTAQISDVDPAASALYNPNGAGALSPWRGSDGQLAVINAWGTACLDPDTLDIHVPVGGGHGNYAGNEPYKYTLGSDSPAWSMLRPPSGAVGNTIALNDGQEATGTYVGDGRNRSIHPYNAVCYAPGVGPIIARQGAPFSQSNDASHKVFRVNPTTGEPSLVFDFANASLTGVASGKAGSGQNGAACYDSLRNRVVSAGTQNNIRLLWVTPTTTPGTWSGGALPADVYLSEGPQGMIYLPVQDRYMSISCGGGAMNVSLVHPTTSAVTFVGNRASGLASGIVLNVMVGFAWAPELGKVLIWNQGSNVAQISTLTPVGDGLTDWTSGALTVSGSNTETNMSTAGNGTFGLFGYSSALRGCYLISQYPGRVYFYATENIG